LQLGRVIDKRFNVLLQQVRGVHRHTVLTEDSGSAVKSASHRPRPKPIDPGREGDACNLSAMAGFAAAHG
jgi:hypothetical protein